ncbi:MAG: type II toxin-antitoxin system RelB/DinJ family antitoxin [Opitutales bacterium]|nr:type II toxin-antitoxin system RelB/DinJ family antitoxin [Opitutales bacterium]
MECSDIFDGACFFADLLVSLCSAGGGRLDFLSSFEQFCAMKESGSTLLRARVDSARYKKAEQVFERLGMKTTDAINIFFAQVALREDLPFAVTTHPERLISDLDQAKDWNQAFGEY